MINRVREVVQQQAVPDTDTEPDDGTGAKVKHRILRRKYMAWNAASAARAEIIEYVEELIDLTKLLVGANEFRSGILMRNTYHDYIQRLAPTNASEINDDDPDAVVDKPTRQDEDDRMSAQPGLGDVRRRRLTTIRSAGSGEEGVPVSLQRIQTRKIEAGMRKREAGEGRGG